MKIFSIRSIAIVISLLFFGSEGLYAGEYGESTPAGNGTAYALTGTFSSTELGTLWLSATGGSTSRGVHFDATSNILTGSLYSSKIGLIEISSTAPAADVSGIRVDCGIGQTLSSKSSGDCTLQPTTGSSISLWSPAVGTISGSLTATIDAATKTLSAQSSSGLSLSNSPGLGNLTTLTGVVLIPSVHHISNGDFGTGVYKSSTGVTIELDSASDAPYTIDIYPLLAPRLTRTYTTDTNSFRDIDLSMGGEYMYEIRDANGNISKGDIKSIPSYISEGAAATSTQYNGVASDTIIQEYCASSPANCPDGSALQATSLESPPGVTGKKADNTEGYTFTLKLRDTYGNKVETVSSYLSLSGTRTITGGYRKSELPTELENPSTSAIDNTSYLRLETPDTPSWSGSDSSASESDYAGGNQGVQVFSRSPNGSLKIGFVIESFNTTATPTSIASISSGLESGDITFTGLIGSQTNGEMTITPGTVVRQSEAVVSHRYSQTGNISEARIEYLISSSGSSGSDDMTIRTLIPMDCTSVRNKINASGDTSSCGLRNSTGGTNKTSVIGYNIPASSATGTIDIGVTFSGGTTTNTGYLIAVASYEINGLVVRYPLATTKSFSIADSTTPQKVAILGQYTQSSLGSSLTGGLDLFNSNFLVTERDKIRKQAKMMRKNIFTTDQTISAIPSDNIMIVEGDIFIESDIWPTSWPDTSLSPRVLIALKKEDGTGGNIYIKEDVKNISSSLIADGSVFGWDGTIPTPTIKIDGSNQLFIYGSVMSNNTIGGATTSQCPRSISECTNHANYDFEKLRALYTNGANDASDVPVGSQSTSVIIQQDPRLQNNSPLTLLRGSK